MATRILLLEADPTLRKHLKSFLHGLGYECNCVDTLAAALIELRERPCRLAIVDLDLAGGDNAAFAAEFRRAAPAVRLIALDSAAEQRPADPPDRPFDAVIPKPFLADPLLAMLPALVATAGVAGS